MPKIDYSAKKYETKTANAGPIWRKGIEYAKTNGLYAKGIETYTGKPANPVRVTNWEKGVELAIRNDAYALGVKGKGDKWKKKYLEAMTA